MEKPGFAWDGDGADITAAINSGRFLVTHRDHGWTGGWGDPLYFTSSVQALNNGNKLPVVWSINCQTGWFDNETDDATTNTASNALHFSEAWERNANGGAVGVIAASRVSYSGHNDRLIWGWTDAIWPGFENYQASGTGFDDPMYEMGPVLNYGKYYYATKYGDNIYRKTEFEMLHWFGDPTMQIWTDQPQTLSVSHVSQIHSGATSLSVTVNQSDAVICVSKDGEILSRGISNGGVNTLSWSQGLNDGDGIHVTVTKHNFRPYEGTVGCSGVCAYSISPTNKSFASSGGSASISVTTESGCSWTASDNAAWINITAGASGTGSGTVNYSVSQNSDTSSRSGTITVGGKTFTVSQSGTSCTYQISPTSKAFESSAGTGSISVTTSDGCEWTATSNDSWISISSGSSGTGSSTVGYSVSENLGTDSRTGGIAVAGNQFTITQSGGDSTVIFPDENLEAAVRDAISKPTGDILKSDLQGLTYLDASGRKIKSLEGIQYCKKIEDLDLRVNDINDISFLSALSEVKKLYLQANNISDISALNNLTSLTLLYLFSNQITDISALSNLTNLTQLYLNSNRITDISALSNLTNLTQLYLDSNRITDISALSNLTNITKIRLQSNQISDISALAGLTRLTLLPLENNKIVNIDSLSNLINLSVLNIQNNQISDISPLSGLTNLTQLFIYDNQISDISPLAGLTNLTNLYIMKNQISDISPLAGVTNLTYLHIYENQISDISALAGLTNLAKIRLHRNQISDISALAGLTQLTRLSLYDNKISDINALKGLNNLSYINLYKNQISNIAPLVDNNGIDAGDHIILSYSYSSNPLNTISCTSYIPELESRGVRVDHDCP